VLLRTAQTSAVEPPFTPDKITIHKTFLRPVLLYGSETWVLTKREENQLLVFEKKVLRTICGPKIENGVYRRRYNHELGKEFNSPNALNITKTSRFHYTGHMVRRPEDLPQKALFRVKPNERRNQGRPKSRWADGVNSDSLALGVRVCTLGHSRHGLFFTRWIVNPMLNLLKRTMTYSGFEPGTFGLAVSIANYYTI
jgi:hypothetical protein